VEALAPSPDSEDMIFRLSSPAGQRPRPLVLAGVSLGYFTVLLDMTVLAVAEPDLAASLHTSVAGLQWATTAYTVVFSALLLSAGAIADRYGADRVFRIGTAVFGVVSVLSALAATLGVLVALRAVLGAAGAACVPASMALVGRLYPEPAERTRAVATWASISGAAVAAGPIVGGVLVDLAGWRAVFLVNAPIVALVLALTAGSALRCPRGDHRIDWAAQVVVCAVLALVTDALIAAGARSWGHAAVATAAAAFAAAAFVLLERRSAARVLNPTLLRSSGVRAGLVAGAAVNFVLNGDLFVLPLLLQHDRHLTAAATGLALLPLTLPFVLNPPLTGRLVARFGPRPPILAGMALLALGGLVSAGAIGTAAGYGWLGVGLLLTGTGVSLVLPALVAAIIAAAPDGTAGAAGGLLNAVRQTGATLGVAAMGALVGISPMIGSASALVLAAVLCAGAGARFALATAHATTG
jgi:MFS transporter, DHA2 family, methylenomycin A resistance protein